MLNSLILLIATAYSSVTFKGKKVKSKGVQKYVGRVKESGRVDTGQLRRGGGKPSPSQQFLHLHRSIV